MKKFKLSLKSELRFFGICFCILMGMTFTLNAQEDNDDCFTLNELHEICRDQSDASAHLFVEKNFLLVSNEESVDYVFGDDTLNLHLTVLQSYDGFNDVYINVFFKLGYSNIIEFNALSSCAEKIKQECESRMSVGTCRAGVSRSFVMGDSLQLDFLEIASDENHIKIICYCPRSMRILINESKDYRLQLEGDREHKQALVLQGLKVADSLAQEKDFEAAIQQLEDIYHLLPEFVPQIDKELGIIKNLYKEEKIRIYTEEADRFYEEGDYFNAFDRYGKVLKEDVNNANALKRGELIRTQWEIMRGKKQLVYSYNEINAENYQDFKSALSSEINQLVSSSDGGALKMKYNIIFDTNKVNQSYFEISDFETTEKAASQDSFEDEMSNLLGHKSLKPSVIDSVAVRSTSVINVDLTWNSYRQLIIKKKNKIENESQYEVDSQIVERMEKDSTLCYGKYYFDIKKKREGNELYMDIYLVKYKKMGGGDAVQKKKASELQQTLKNGPIVISKEDVEL